MTYAHHVRRAPTVLFNAQHFCYRNGITRLLGSKDCMLIKQSYVVLERTYSTLSQNGRIQLNVLIFILDPTRLLERPHVIGNKPIKVIKRPPKKKIPLDPLKVHVQGLKEGTSDDSLFYYLDKFSDVDVSKLQMGCNNNAMVVFVNEPGNDTNCLRFSFRHSFSCNETLCLWFL